MHSQLGTLSVPDDYGFNLEKDKESLITLKTLRSLHFVRQYYKDYENLRLELRWVRLQWYFPGNDVVKEGFNIYVTQLRSGEDPELRNTLKNTSHQGGRAAN